jgi:hypothetical protein
MKKQSENPFAPLIPEQVDTLTEIVKEILAKPKSFSPADLWDIQRRSRTIMRRRYLA